MRMFWIMWQGTRMRAGLSTVQRGKMWTLCLKRLAAEGIAVTKYHAGLGNVERQQNQEDFIYERSLVMVATNAFGMGIDKSDMFAMSFITICPRV